MFVFIVVCERERESRSRVRERERNGVEATRAGKKSARKKRKIKEEVERGEGLVFLFFALNNF